MGTVVRGNHNEDRVAWGCAEVGTGFTGAKGMAQAFIRDLGSNNEELEIIYEPIPDGEGPWLSGRGAFVLIMGEIVGSIGEIDPSVAELFELRVPIQAGEFDVDALMRLIPDPVL